MRNNRMMKLKPFSKIVWALDAFEEPSRLQIPLRTLTYLAGVTDSVIQPVYVMSSDSSFDFEGTEHSRGGTEQKEISADQKKVENLFKDIQHSHLFENLLPPQVIEAALNFPHRATDSLIAYAEEAGADLIVVYTHGWSGLNRTIRGSFVERLVTRSTIPVLTLGPEITETMSFNRILYASHLNSFSRQAFRQAVAVAGEFHSQLTVLHILSRRERDFDSDNSTSIGEDLPVHSQIMRRTRAWTNWAMKKGVQIEYMIEDSSFQVFDQILRMARSHQIGLILLEARSGHLASILKGSRVRNLIRLAPCPVWVQNVYRKQRLRDYVRQPFRRAV